MDRCKLRKKSIRQLNKYEDKLVDKWLSKFLDGMPRKRLINEIDKTREILAKKHS